jgi:hypothetical protein
MRVRLFIIAFLTALSSAGYGSELPEPKCLSKNIDFWHDVYTKYDDQDGLILDADSQELVVLKKVRLPVDERKRKDVLKAIRAGYEKSNTKIRIITGIKSKFKEGLVRDAKYRSSVEAEIKKAGLPAEISALPHVESGYNPRARSKVGAVGLWQVMPATARHLGFDPKHLLSPSYNTRVGLAVLMDAYAKLGSWPLAITAYNHGVNGVARAIKETGSTDVCTILSDYSGPRFGVSSRNFYASFLAVLRVLRDEGVIDE